MKKPILILFLILLCFSSYSQKIRFSDSTNTWKVIAYNCGGDDSYSGVKGSYLYYGDIVINGTLYNILGSYVWPHVYIREDTVANKIWAYFSGDTAEILLYDFSLNVNDTFKSPNATHVVDSISIIIINGVAHKVWYMNSLTGNPYVDYYVIEGIGSSNGPLYSKNPYFFETCINLTCFSNNGTSPPLTPKVRYSFDNGYYFDNTTSCSVTHGVGVKQIPIDKTIATVVCNPVNEHSKIVIPNSIQSGSVVIINGMGQRVISMPFYENSEVLIGDKIKTPGIYCYQITDNKTGLVYIGKLVRE